MLREIRGGVLGISGEETIGRRKRQGLRPRYACEGGASEEAGALGYLHQFGTDDPWVDVQDPARAREKDHDCKQQRDGRKTGMIEGTGYAQLS